MLEERSLFVQGNVGHHSGGGGWFYPRGAWFTEAFLSTSVTEYARGSEDCLPPQMHISFKHEEPSDLDYFRQVAKHHHSVAWLILKSFRYLSVLTTGEEGNGRHKHILDKSTPQDFTSVLEHLSYEKWKQTQGP